MAQKSPIKKWVKEMKNIKFYEAEEGNASNSRIIADLVILYALALAQQVILFRGDAGIMVAASAAGTIFLTVGGAAMAFLFVQKKTEDKQLKNENS